MISARTMQLFEIVDKYEMISTLLMQIMTNAAAMAEVNFRTHVVTNFRPRIKRWIRLRIGTYAFFGNMHQRKLKSWAGLLLWAGTTLNQSVTTLLPRYTSLSTPDAATMVLLSALVNNIRQEIGPANLPVTDRLLRRRSEAYMPILHRVLTDLVPAAANNQQGTKLFTLLPQGSNQAAFVKITSSGLHRYSVHCMQSLDIYGK